SVPVSTTTSASVPTASEVIAHLPWKWRTQGAIFIIGGLGFMFDAWDVALNGFLIPLLSDYWDLSVGQAAWIATANLIGMALGAFVWGGIADVIGRKKAFTLTLLVFSIFTVAGAFAPAYGWFILFRLLAGFGLGGCIPVDYALVGEFTPSRHRGRVLTAMDGWWPIGASLCAFVSAYLLEFGDWRLIMLAMIIPALLTVAVRFGIPESPLYLASVGRFEEADAVIARLVERTGAEVREWTHDEPAAVPNTGPETSPETVRAASGPSVGRQLRAASGQLVQLWQHSARITLVSWSLFVSILLVYYAALTWLPRILKQHGLEDQAAFLVTGPMSAVRIVGVIAAARIIGFGVVVQIAIPTLYTYVSELYPTRLRGSGFGWASAASRLATGIAPIVYGAFMWPVLGLTVTFILTGVLVVAAVVLMGFLARETTGEELS